MMPWRPVTRDNPCPACGKGDRCNLSDDGRVYCWRSSTAPDGYRIVPTNGGGALFRPVSAGRPARGSGTNPIRRSEATTPSAADFAVLADRFDKAISPEQVASLALKLGVTVESLRAIRCGWATRDELRTMRASGAGWNEDYPDGAFVFAERDGGGRIVGLSLRAEDGRKGAPRGGKRGLVVPQTLKNHRGAVLIVEGASDVAAMLTLGLMAVGRPSNAGGAEHLATMLKRREALVLGEHDMKETGAWPGRDGADNVAQRLAAGWGEPVRIAFPPDGSKDLRAWLNRRVADGLDLSDPAACAAAGKEFLALIEASADEVDAPKTSQAERLVALALEWFRFGQSDDGQAFAVRRDGPNVAMMLKGSRDALRATLAREFRRRCGSTANSAALTDALNTLAGEALECEAEPVALRLAEREGGFAIDLGDAAGRAVVVHPGRWEVAETSPVLFKRTNLTGPLPEPERGGELSKLRELLNVTDDDWPLLVGWLVAGMISNIAHPILMLGGEFGTGKSTAARMLVGLIDPSPASLRTQPESPRDWATVAAGSWAVCIDNVSAISAWFSDALCRAVSGDAWVARTLYSDADPFVAAFRRVLCLTSIDPGALRGDLGDRLLLIDLERIPDNRRRSETLILADYERMRPRLFGAMLDLLARVLAELPSVELAAMPRLADFARVQSAVDLILGTNGLAVFMDQRDRLAADVIDGDSVGGLIRAMLDAEGGSWRGTAGALFERLRPDKPGPDFPKTARGMGGRLKRLIPALRATGIDVTYSRTGHDRRRLYTIGYGGDSTVRTVRMCDSINKDAGCRADGSESPTVRDSDQPSAISADRPQPSAIDGTKTAFLTAWRGSADGADGADGSAGSLSEAIRELLTIPDGWTAARWSANLRRLASACESNSPSDAADYYRAASILEAQIRAGEVA